MSHFTPEFEELVDMFCDGDMSAEQAERLATLAAETAEAHEYLKESLQVHCELVWELNKREEDPPAAFQLNEAPVPFSVASRWQVRRRWLFTAALIPAVAAVIMILATFFRGGRPETLSPSSGVAQIKHLSGVAWQGGESAAVNSPLRAGRKLTIRQGLMEVRFNGGTTMIVEGPAELQLQSPSSASLVSGSLFANVPPASHGFTIHTPNVAIVDRGTRFGVACLAGQTDVEVFSDSVLLRPEASQQAGGPSEQIVAANTAVRVSGVPGKGVIKTEPLASGSRHFVQSMTGSTAQLQSLVGSDPHLIHFYPFEGATSAERLRDRRGDLDMNEVAMRDGNGGGRLEFKVSGPDPSTHVVAALPGKQYGAAQGWGLQSKAFFQPPAVMTVELLLNLSSVGKSAEGFIASAITTRHDRDQCGFLVAAIDRGELAYLFDGEAAWLQSGFTLVPGRWYYLASTFAVDHGNTRVNAFVADLSQKNPNLNWIVRNQLAAGTVSSGFLSIGKGFDGEMASEYPWPGQLGNVAIYDALLPREMIENHLMAVIPHAGNEH